MRPAARLRRRWAERREERSSPIPALRRTPRQPRMRPCRVAGVADCPSFARRSSTAPWRRGVATHHLQLQRLGWISAVPAISGIPPSVPAEERPGPVIFDQHPDLRFGHTGVEDFQRGELEQRRPVTPSLMLGVYAEMKNRVRIEGDIADRLLEPIQDVHPT